MTLVPIYRVEHQDWLSGPYAQYRDPTLRQLAEKIEAQHMEREHSHPTPFTKGEVWDDDWVREDEYFGFLDLDSLLLWFEGWIPALLSHGFRMRQYQVPYHSIKVGNSGQVSFRPDNRPAVQATPRYGKYADRHLRQILRAFDATKPEYLRPNKRAIRSRVSCRRWSEDF